MKKLVVLMALIAACSYNVPMKSGTFTEVASEQEFKSQLQGDTVVVMFGSSSCPHCRKMKPIFSQAAQSAGNAKFIFAEINSPKLLDLTYQYNIKGMPTFKVFRNGKEVASRTGEMSKQELSSFVNQK